MAYKSICLVKFIISVLFHHFYHDVKLLVDACGFKFPQMIFPWMFDEVHALRPFKEAAHLLAEKEDWPPLYDIAALKNNKV